MNGRGNEINGAIDGNWLWSWLPNVINYYYQEYMEINVVSLILDVFGGDPREEKAQGT